MNIKELKAKCLKELPGIDKVVTAREKDGVFCYFHLGNLFSGDYYRPIFFVELNYERSFDICLVEAKARQK